MSVLLAIFCLLSAAIDVYCGLEDLRDGRPVWAATWFLWAAGMLASTAYYAVVGP